MKCVEELVMTEVKVIVMVITADSSLFPAIILASVSSLLPSTHDPNIIASVCFSLVDYIDS